MEGLLVKAVSSFYYVDSQNALYECKARGAFRNLGISPVVGDRVEFTPTDDTHGVLEAVLPRKNLLKRPLVANIDKLFIVSAFKTPAPDTLMIDRLCAVAVYNGISPVLIFNKSDMGDMSDFVDIYRRTGFSVYIASAREDIGIDKLRAETKGCVCAFAGNSGVGKSSILNSMFSGINAKTGEVSEKLGRGRHTTRHTKLYKFGNSYIVDTPGFAAAGFDNLFETDISLADCFPDFKEYITSCKYSDCSHTCEPGCGLIAAVKGGLVDKNRHQNYVTLFSEVKSAKKW